ncbi:MAG: formate dehydrogenase accessory sulfurtransferase FdhD [Cyclobacteriaceae bacterium]
MSSTETDINTSNKQMANKKVSAVRYNAGQPLQTFEILAGEEALQIKINSNPYTITMRTPGHDSMLAAGLLLTERVIKDQEDIIGITEIPASAGDHTVIVDVQVKEEALVGKNLFNRSIASSASCGVCGKIELCDLLSPEQPLLNSGKLDIELIPELLQQMQAEQATFVKTGGSHAAGVFSIDGELLSVKEDIGRHNAVDKAIGDLLLRGSLENADILFISGRVSYEIAAKCAEANIPFLLAVSAPSSLAVDFCSRNGITLIGFCRENRATVYANERNILQHASTAPIPSVTEIVL